LPLLFINNTIETFTPTASGALATIIWECCRVAERQGRRPAVISRACSIPPFPWPQTTFIDYPSVPTSQLGVLFHRADRKLTHWRHLRQREYANRVVEAIRSNGLLHLPMVPINDPELAVVLRDAFPRGRIVHWFQNQQECKPRFRRLFAGAVDAVAGCSNFISRWVEGHYGLKTGTARTLYNGVDSQAFTRAGQEAPGVPVVNFVGRTGIEKAPDLVLKAALRIAKKTNHFGVQLIGSNHWDRFEMDSYQQQLVELTREVEAAGVPVRRPGHIGRRDLPNEFRKAHVHVVPSRWDEPSALSIYEGMACGLPTVASRTGGTPEIIDGHGFLFERDSVDGLADSLEALLSDPELRRKYAALARERASEFTWDRVWTGIMEMACA
jgi:glycosyltransferase involved in cell wall biosynthesis